MPRVRIVGVSKRYGRVTALDRVTLELEDKEYLSILGPSGCGKTTLIKCIAGIIRPDEGRVYVDDRDLTDVPIQERGVGYVFQEVALFPHMSVSDNVSYGPRVKGWPPERAERMAKEMLSMVRLEDRAEAYPRELSGGAQQEVAVVRAFASGSSLLLLDEPLGALDAKVRAKLRYELRQLVTDLGLTAIHVTHDQEEALSISDRVVVMKAGRIAEVGTPMQLYLQPKRIFTANFVGEANFLQAKVLRRGEEAALDVDGLELHCPIPPSVESGRVVVAIRPEFISFEDHGSSGCNVWQGRVESQAFAGSVMRYQVRLTNGLALTVKRPLVSEGPELAVGEKVVLSLPKEHILIYPFPEGGLDQEIALE
ncbi:MAG: ABC transporter ATP-binding protein [Candidatus Bathyarchaeia archaeon]